MPLFNTKEKGPILRIIDDGKLVEVCAPIGLTAARAQELAKEKFGHRWNTTGIKTDCRDRKNHTHIMVTQVRETLK